MYYSSLTGAGPNLIGVIVAVLGLAIVLDALRRSLAPKVSSERPNFIGVVVTAPGLAIVLDTLRRPLAPKASERLRSFKLPTDGRLATDGLRKKRKGWYLATDRSFCLTLERKFSASSGGVSYPLASTGVAVLR